MKIISKELHKCKTCGNLQGFVEEQFNGRVLVACPCTSIDVKKQNPTMIAYLDGKLRWRPMSDYKDEDGHYWHVPHFASPLVVRPMPKSKKNPLLY